MENERIRGLRIFRGALRRAFCSKVYIFQCAMVFILSFSSMFLLKRIYNLQDFIPKIGIESLKIGNVYNIGILSVRSLDVYAYSAYDELLAGALSGSFIQALMAWAIAGFISAEFKNGYFRFQLTRGAKRFELFLKYVSVALINALTLIVIYVLGLILSVRIEGAYSGMERYIDSPERMVLLVLYQMLMLMGIAVVMAVFMMVVEGIRWLIFLESVVFVAPLLPTYLSMFTGGSELLERWSIFSAVINISANGFENFGFNIVILVLNVIAAGVIGGVILLRRNYK